MKLELGAGGRPTPGYIHHDFRKLEDIEIVCDVNDIGKYLKEGSCSEIRATHFLEHFSHRDTNRLLKAWLRLLRPEGILYLEVPNLRWQAEAFLRSELTPEEVAVYMYGEQDHTGNFHYNGFTKESLLRALQGAGFKENRCEVVTQVLCSWSKP